MPTIKMVRRVEGFEVVVMPADRLASFESRARMTQLIGQVTHQRPKTKTNALLPRNRLRAIYMLIGDHMQLTIKWKKCLTY